MKSNIRLEDISDGQLYTITDKVKADTGGCVDCSACCHGFGDLVVLNPYDVYEITRYLDTTFDDLLIHHLELHESDKITLPHLKTSGADDGCPFLNSEGRCSIHAYRPDICRLFPLGRAYDDNDFKYFLQSDVCVKPNLTETEVQAWIGVQHYAENKAFILAWYRLQKALAFRAKFIRDPEELVALNTYLLDTFYRMPIHEEKSFYAAFHEKLPAAKNYLGII